MTLWRPLKVQTFRNLLLANVVSDIGTFMQTVGAAWLMLSMNAGPFYVALTQTASALPFFVLAVPAGAIGDIVDRRRLILSTETWMVSIALLLTVFTFAGLMTPVLLLVLTFALSAGDAFENPTWRSILPELVDKDDLAAASALNGIEFNFARAVGPGIAGLVVAVAGVGSAFLINTASFAGVLLVIARWKRPLRPRTLAPEGIVEAMGSGIRYVRYSPVVITLLIRNGSFIFFASALLSLLPSLAHRVKDSPSAYGVLLGGFGLGAVCGALLMQRARARWPTEIVLAGAIAAFGAALLAMGGIHQYWILLFVVISAGAAWVVFNSIMNVLILNQAPEWVRARVLAASQLVFQGSVAAGSALWGFVGQHAGLHSAMVVAGCSMLITIAVALVLPLPESTVDVAAWDPWRVPSVHRSIQPELLSGAAVLVTVEYFILTEQRAAFLAALRQYGRIRRRDGAREWGIFEDIEQPDRYVETFIIPSWVEHLRQHERLTQADREVVELVEKLLQKPAEVRHLISAES